MAWIDLVRQDRRSAVCRGMARFSRRGTTRLGPDVFGKNGQEWFI